MNNYNGEFSDHSYGFTSLPRALRVHLRRICLARLDTVNHDRLLNALRDKIGSGNATPRERHSKSEAKRQTLRSEVKLLRLIGRYLRAGVELPDGTREATPQGVPQVGPCHRC